VGDGDLNLDQIKVIVKQAFGRIDAIIFEAALTINAKETRINRRSMQIDVSPKNLWISPRNSDYN